MKPFGKPAFGTVYRTFAAEYRGKATFFLLHENTYDQKGVDYDKGKNQNSIDVFHIIVLNSSLNILPEKCCLVNILRICDPNDPNLHPNYPNQSTGLYSWHSYVIRRLGSL